VIAERIGIPEGYDRDPCTVIREYRQWVMGITGLVPAVGGSAMVARHGKKLSQGQKDRSILLEASEGDIEAEADGACSVAGYR